MTDKKTITSTGELGEAEGIPVLLRGLNRVEAPGDFDFRVRARIADGRPSGSGLGWFRPALQVGVPAVMVLAAGIYIATNTGFVGDSDLQTTSFQTQPVGTTDAVVPPAPENPQTAAISQPPITAPGSDTTTEIATIPAKVTSPAKSVQTAVKKKPAAAQRETEIPEGGSIDQAAREVQVLTVPDEEPTPEPETAAKPKTPNAILRDGGIAATKAGENWRVVSVTAGSAAQQAGLRSGDVIEGISIAGGKARLTVDRDGKKIPIEFKP